MLDSTGGWKAGGFSRVGPIAHRVLKRHRSSSSTRTDRSTIPRRPPRTSRPAGISRRATARPSSAPSTASSGTGRGSPSCPRTRGIGRRWRPWLRSTTCASAITSAAIAMGQPFALRQVAPVRWTSRGCTRTPSGREDAPPLGRKRQVSADPHPVRRRTGRHRWPDGRRRLTRVLCPT